jgi:hypothetical protein
MEVEMESFGYNWLEMVVSRRRSELEQETEKIQMLMDAGLYNPSLFRRMVDAIEKRLVRLGLHVRKNHNERQRAYQATTSKYAA